MEKISIIFNNRRLVRYFIMAVAIVSVELVVFQIIYQLTRNYYFATVLSFILGVMLNWLGGRIFVFGVSHHHPAHEFGMVLIASLVGVVIQLAVVFVIVQAMGFYPLVGKMFSICFSFFWNYWFRAKVVYKQ